MNKMNTYFSMAFIFTSAPKFPDIRSNTSF